MQALLLTARPLPLSFRSQDCLQSFAVALHTVSFPLSKQPAQKFQNSRERAAAQKQQPGRGQLSSSTHELVMKTSQHEGQSLPLCLPHWPPAAYAQSHCSWSGALLPWYPPARCMAIACYQSLSGALRPGPQLLLLLLGNPRLSVLLCCCLGGTPVTAPAPALWCWEPWCLQPKQALVRGSSFCLTHCIPNSGDQLCRSNLCPY